MLDITKILIGEIRDKCRAAFVEHYSDESPALLDFVRDSTSMAMHAISCSNALYHDIEHTARVTMTGIEILRVRQQQCRDLDAALWANTITALLFHDIGYARGASRADTHASIATGRGGTAVANLPGQSDAYLLPFHVDRGQLIAEEAFAGHDVANAVFIQQCIERTRFPVPADHEYQCTDDLPGLVRAADLIGQLSDPRYLSKLPAVFCEFEENGLNEKFGYAGPGDLLTAYPVFFETCVAPYIDAAEMLLRCSFEGQETLSHLYHNLDVAKDASRRSKMKHAAA